MRCRACAGLEPGGWRAHAGVTYPYPLSVWAWSRISVERFKSLQNEDLGSGVWCCLSVARDGCVRPPGGMDV